MIVSMDYRIIKKLRFKLENVIHVGAHKFEELDFYQSFQSIRVLWIDPLDIYLPSSLPTGHSYLRYFVTDNAESHTNFITYRDTAMSSSKIVANPRNILLGTPGNNSESRVPNISGRDLQEVFTTGSTPPKNIDLHRRSRFGIRSASILRPGENFRNNCRDI